MSEPDSKSSLVISQSGALSSKSVCGLTKRGLSDLQSLESAEKWLKRAEELFAKDGKKLLSVTRQKNNVWQSCCEWFQSKEHYDKMQQYFACLQRAIAASPTYPKALIELGTAHLHGRGVGEDRIEALRLFRMAAELANPDELCDMAHEIQQDNICESWPEGMKEAEHMYRMAAEHSHPGAQYSLGKMYATGKEGLPRDYELAKYWFTKAADSDSEFPSAEVALRRYWTAPDGT